MKPEIVNLGDGFGPLNIDLIPKKFRVTTSNMSTQPQAVTERYVSNLIHNGRNKEFDIDVMTRRSHFEGEEHVGYYFTVTVTRGADRPGTGQQASGATIAQAVRRAPEKHGVTFR